MGKKTVHLTYREIIYGEAKVIMSCMHNNYVKYTSEWKLIQSHMGYVLRELTSNS